MAGSGLDAISCAIAETSSPAMSALTITASARPRAAASGIARRSKRHTSISYPAQYSGIRSRPASSGVQSTRSKLSSTPPTSLPFHFFRHTQINSCRFARLRAYFPPIITAAPTHHRIFSFSALYSHAKDPSGFVFGRTGLPAARRSHVLFLFCNQLSAPLKAHTVQRPYARLKAAHASKRSSLCYRSNSLLIPANPAASGHYTFCRRSASLPTPRRHSGRRRDLTGSNLWPVKSGCTANLPTRTSIQTRAARRQRRGVGLHARSGLDAALRHGET